MSDCSMLSDRMPSVALGEADWTDDEARHLSSCPSCRSEWALLRTTAGLGEDPVAEMDMPSISRSLQQRLGRAAEGRRKRKAWGFAGMAAAAALAGILWSGGADRPTPAAPAPVAARLEIPLPELEELQPAELDSMLRGLDLPVADLDTLETTDTEAGGAPSLETVYDYWEG